MPIQRLFRGTALLCLLLVTLSSQISNALASENASTQLQALIDDHWQYYLEENPTTAGRMGVPGYNHRLPAAAPADIQRRLRAEQTFLQRLEGIERSELDDTQQVNYDLFGWVLENSIEGDKLGLERIPLNTFYGFHSLALNASKGLAMRKVSDYEDYLKRLGEIPRYFRENIANMRRGVEDGFVLPKIVVQGIAPTVRAQVYSDPTKSSLYEPFEALPATMPEAEQQRLQAAGKKVIGEAVIPAFREFADFFEGDYLTAATDSLGAEQLPGGKDYYRHEIKQYVTLDMDPAEIHKIGLAEVKRIRAEMDALIKESGFKGDFKAFTKFLRTDPQFYAKTAEELLKEAAYVAKQIDYVMPEFFGHLPRMPYGIVPVPDEIAPNYTTASYNSAAIGGTRGGAYWLNTYALDQRPLYELPALTLHEGVPGHHHQNALSQELENVPEFRKQLYLSAYGEGWGLYSERLGIEMGIYKTPYEHFGRLSYEMWRACRLVIDTGVHSQGWSREQALDFLADNTSLSEGNVRAEVDRYISWPGQALSYKMGEIKIRELRAEAEAALGDDFDIRAFHDALLGNGALPLSLLEAQMDAFVARQKLQIADPKNKKK
ncbi:DUF885 domain-containing protein [Biformimicrobium ophioploci]|uniref:DUF885 domain-containing protein n=1 Tax=Biformimicrobium ophioploci TaxID=3036711 RepID=A0ABQ6LWB5_9GAMM|nr:DUF885 domain-containing protein [Microbulbifer sp. NKW57]GMG86359.1 DUF885 domain-containing protein [Microbulbifer sp. NKW57]